MGVTTPVRGHSSLPESRRLPQNELRFENHLLPARRLVCSIADAAEAQRDLTGQRKTAVPRAPVRSTETVASHGALHSMSHCGMWSAELSPTGFMKKVVSPEHG